MFFEEKLVFGVAYFFFDFDVFFGRGRRQGQGPSRPQILQYASTPGHAVLPLRGAANLGAGAHAADPLENTTKTVLF